MKSRLPYLILFIFLFFSGKTFSQTISVTDNFTAQDLVQNYLINSGCASVSNFSVTGGSFGVQDSYGYFTDGGTSFPFANGVVLATGRAVSAVGPNASLLSEDLSSWAGDSDLEQALSISNSTNATVLEFDFVPTTNKISFDYIFSSEQYLSNPSSNQCNFTDGFAFLLKPVSGGQYQNLAVVPGTTIPVKVNTVRGSGTICTAANEQYFDAFNGVNHPTNYNGQTIPLKAEATVIPGTLYHIKLVIADQGNGLYDSAIFLKGGSFRGSTNITASINIPFCAGQNVVLTANTAGSSYKWFKDGLPIPSQTNQTYTITDNNNLNEVLYSVEVTGTSSCISTGEIKIKFNALPTITNQTLTQCDEDNDGITTFNLRKLDNLVRNGNVALGNVTYFETSINTPITNPEAYINATTNTVYASVTNASGCSAISTITLNVSNAVISAVSDLEVCDDDLTTLGIASFVFPSTLVPTYDAEYYLNIPDAILQKNAIVSPFINTVPNEQIIYARLINGPDCIDILPVKLIVNTFNPPNFQDETLTLCDGESITLNVSNTFATYDWIGRNDFDSEIEASSSGDYLVKVTDVNNCAKIKKFILKSSGAATNIDAITEDFAGNSNSIIITYSDNGGDYQFSIDGVNYQNSPIFNDLSAGEYTIYVKDKNGCLPIPSKAILILDYPKFFTPNEDGINDIWMIKNINTKPNTIINIFDRYGKLLKQFDSNSVGWNGIYNGEKLPSGDYWFTLTLFNNKTVRSHFALKR
jgi:gliding motility-associated-like protein